jgi:hypothetical protein
MDNYFTSKRFVNALLNDNFNTYFIHAITNYMNNIKDDEVNRIFVNYIINKLQGFLHTHINDVRFGAVGKYKNDYIMLKDDLMIHTLNYLNGQNVNKDFINKIFENYALVDDKYEVNSLC